MSKVKALIAFVVMLLFAGTGAGQDANQTNSPTSRTKVMVESVARASFPEIKLHKIHVKTFESEKVFFKARYSIWRFATFQRMRHLVFVNPRAFAQDLPNNAFRSIIAHELSHVSYYTRKNRLELLGLIRLTSGSSATAFERKADLEAIAKGYGPGLIEYREWLYKQIPEKARKSRVKTYFTPEEIALIIRAVGEKPELVSKWRNNVPRDLETIKNDTGYK